MTREFYGTISAEAEAAGRTLDGPGRGQLALALPEAWRAPGWEAALSRLAESPQLEPLAARIRATIEREADAAMRLRIGTAPDNAHLRDLILASLERGLDPPEESEP